MYRCRWTADKDLNIHYHDNEWGVPVHDDTKLFEFLILDAFQAGLSWLTILKKRENFRRAFSNFEYELVARYDAHKIEELMLDEGIIRNRLKIEASVLNAQKFIEVRREFGSFDTYIWSFTGGRTIVNSYKDFSEIPARSAESDTMSKDLIRRGFKFVGSTICYAFMQAAGMINDHETQCFRYEEICRMYREGKSEI